jgi:hypothetical protein
MSILHERIHLFCITLKIILLHAKYKFKMLSILFQKKIYIVRSQWIAQLKLLVST